METPTSGQSPALSLSTPPQTSGIICATVVLGTPDICPTADGGVSISWEWGAVEHSIDVRSDGANMEWCQYNPRTLQTIETKLPMDGQGWDTILAGLNKTAV